MAGPRPKPTRLRELSGNAGKRKINKNEPRPTSIGQCPKFLKDEAREEWHRIAPELHALGLLSGLDAAALAVYCEAFQTWRRATDSLKKDGMVHTTQNGYPTPSPYIAIANAASETMRKLLLEFGCSPASRSKISIARPPEEIDPLGKLINRLSATQPKNQEKPN